MENFYDVADVVVVEEPVLLQSQKLVQELDIKNPTTLLARPLK